MTLRSRVLGAILMIVALALASLALALSYVSPCSAPDALPADTKRMRAIV